MQGSVVRSWLCELAALAFEQEGNDLASLEPYVEDSGEGRWTVEDAIDKRVPAPVITTSLYERFSSRGQDDVRGEGERRAAQPVRRPRGQGEGRSPDGRDRPVENPLGEGLERLPVHPTTLVDLRRAPATSPSASCCRRIYNLAHEGALPERFNLIGVSRSRDARRRVPRDGARVDREVLAPQAEPGGARGAARARSATSPGTLRRPVGLRAARRRSRDEFDEEAGIAFNRVFYLSTAPTFFPVIVEQLGEHGLDQARGRRGAGGDREADRHEPRGGARS